MEEERPYWTAGRLRNMLLHYRLVEERCRSGFDTALGVGDENEDPLSFVGKLGKMGALVPGAVRNRQVARCPALHCVVEAKVDVDRALASLPRWAALLLLCTYADGWTAEEIAGKLHGRRGWSRRQIMRRKAQAFSAALNFLE